MLEKMISADADIAADDTAEKIQQIHQDDREEKMIQQMIDR